METIIEKHNYFNPNLLYVKDSMITEYDIQSAGFSVLKFKKLLSDDEVIELEAMPKFERNLKIGLMQKKHPTFSKSILDTLTEVRRDFCKLNNIKRINILAIKKDAIVLVNKSAKHLKILNHFDFINKGSFTSYLRVNKYEFYLNSVTKAYLVKGFGNNVTTPIIRFILDIMLKIEPFNKAETYDYLQRIQNKYLNYKLDKEVYREFTSEKFLLKDFDLQLDEISNVEELDISYNYINLLREAIINMIS